MIAEERHFECPLCGVDFDGAKCHGSCPFARGCAMVRCPACGYEFVGDGLVTRLLQRLRPARKETT